MSTTAQSLRPRKARSWLRWIALALLGFAFAVAALYVYLFVRIAPAMSVEVVDAVTDKPLPNMDVCLQVVASGMGNKQALRSELLRTNTKGEVFFGYSIHDLAILQAWDGYSLHLSDPKSDFSPRCGPQVGFELSHFSDLLGDSRADGTQYFPGELTERAANSRQRDLGWTRIQRSTTFKRSMRVELIPIMPTPDGCKQIVDARSAEECIQLNTQAVAALQQELLPMNFGGMTRTEVLGSDDGSNGSSCRGYATVYVSQSVPPVYVPVLIEQFPDDRSAIEHFDCISRAIPDYDPGIVSEDEPIPGQKIKRIVTPANSRAFWISGRRLLLITFIRPPVLDRSIIMEWLVRNPSTMHSPTS